ncbi:MAG TPA: hypothetical protein VJQ47_05360 [Steroidobacteraceae bacterium]|nr:hypothetical protein [Steroidobacteraceae bacterium]
MEKTIFLFRRKEGVRRSEFAKHYIERHAPLGARLTRCLMGYTVNLVESEGGPDAVTEHWVPSAMDLLTPSRAYATAEEFQRVLTDDRSFIGDFELYVVTEEELVIAAEPLATPLGRETPEAKAVWMYGDAGALPPPPRARRVIDNRVSRKLVYRGHEGWEAAASDIAIIRMAWAAGFDQFGASLSEALRLREYRFIAAPPAVPIFR